MSDELAPVVRANGREFFRKTTPLFTMAEFLAFPLEKRVGLVLADGQWYTADKVASIVRSRDVDAVRSIMDGMVEDAGLLMHDNGLSYRMSLEQLEDWRSRNHVPLHAQVVDKILYPRIFGSGAHRRTEVELFLEVPLHRVGYVTLKTTDNADMDKFREDMGYIGELKESSPGVYKLYCLSANYVKKKVLAYENANGGPGTFFIPGGVNTYNVAMRREVSEFNQYAVEDLIRFYVQFSQILNPTIRKTLDHYLPSTDRIGLDSTNTMKTMRDSQITEWVISAITKYNEQRGIPFAVYVEKSMPRHAYEYASRQIGPEVNQFQLKKAKAIKTLDRTNKNRSADDYYTDELVHRTMVEDGYDITWDQYREYDDALKTWQKSRTAHSFEWDTTGEEKFLNDNNHQPTVLSGAEHENIDAESQHRIQLSAIRAAIKTGDYDSGIIMLKLLGNSSTLMEAMDKGNVQDVLGNKYCDELAVNLALLNRASKPRLI